MTTREGFEALAAEWAQHCDEVAFSSNMADYLDGAAAAKIIAMGTGAIPLIMERYASDDLPWHLILERITGITMNDDPTSVDPAETKESWLAWWRSANRN